MMGLIVTIIYHTRALGTSTSSCSEGGRRPFYRVLRHLLRPKTAGQSLVSGCPVNIEIMEILTSYSGRSPSMIYGTRLVP